MRRRALVRALVDYLPASQVGARSSSQSVLQASRVSDGISQSLHALPSLTFFPRAQLRDSCGRLCLSSGPGLSADGSRRSAPMEVALHGSAAGRVMTVCHPLFFSRPPASILSVTHMPKPRSSRNCGAVL